MRTRLFLLLATFTLAASSHAVQLVRLTLDQSTYVGGDPILGVVLLDVAAPGQVTVTLSDNTSAVNTPVSAVVPNGANHKTFTCTTTPVAATVTRTISAKLVETTKIAYFQLAPKPKLVSVVITPNVVTGGEEGFNGTVNLDGISPKNGTYIDLNDNSSAITLSQPQGFSPSNFDWCGFAGSTSAVSTLVTRQVTATLNGVTKTADLIIHPKPIFIGLTASRSVIESGGVSFIFVHLSGRVPSFGMRADVSESSSVVTVDSNLQYLENMEGFQIAVGQVTAYQSVPINVTIRDVTKTIYVVIAPTG